MSNTQPKFVVLPSPVIVDSAPRIIPKLTSPPTSAWQSAGRGGRTSQSTSRTPQNRSGAASPARSHFSAQTSKDNAGTPRPSTSTPTQAAAPPSNVWTQRAAASTATAVTTSNNSGNGNGSGAGGGSTGNGTRSNGPAPPPRPENPTLSPAVPIVTSDDNNAAAAVAPPPLTHASVNGFNAAEVRAFLARSASTTAYHVPDSTAATAGMQGGKDIKANLMANHQPFFAQLAKQIATFEGGG